jgi:hypothetical protein
MIIETKPDTREKVLGMAADALDAVRRGLSSHRDVATAIGAHPDVVWIVLEILEGGELVEIGEDGWIALEAL